MPCDRLVPAPLAPITAIRAALRTGALTVEQLVQTTLDRIAVLNPQLNAFITVLSDAAIARAIELDHMSPRDWGELHGIPIAVKDNIDTANILTTLGSAYFRDRVPATSAAIVQQLEAAGTVLLGKTNLSELAADASGHSVYGDLYNPWNLAHTTGGSSGGMASAIAAGLCVAGIGTDTGGSIRIPASWTGIVGLRPTHGAVSTVGVFPRAPSFDVVGVMARCVADGVALWGAIEPDDSQGNRAGNTLADLSGIRLGLINHYTFRDVDAVVAAALHRVLQLCEQRGAAIVRVDCPIVEAFEPRLYSTIGLYEFYQALAATLQQTPKVAWEQQFGAKVQRDLSTGCEVTITDYNRTQSIRDQQIDEFREIFKTVDVLLTPTMPRIAPLITEPIIQRDRRFVQPFSWLGLPALSLPCGWSGNLPIGLQLIGDRHTESQLWQIAAELEAMLGLSLDRQPQNERG
jgi:aspartyl-tRNA(Asn)/glutamyl-tRNA(Gln) amidotransferase subunit A